MSGDISTLTIDSEITIRGKYGQIYSSLSNNVFGVIDNLIDDVVNRLGR